MNDSDVQQLFSTEIEKMNGEELGNLVIWFNRTPLDTILTLFNGDKLKLKELETIISMPIEFGIDLDKLEALRDYLD